MWHWMIQESMDAPFLFCFQRSLMPSILRWKVSELRAGDHYYMVGLLIGAKVTGNSWIFIFHECIHVLKKGELWAQLLDFYQALRFQILWKTIFRFRAQRSETICNKFLVLWKFMGTHSKMFSIFLSHIFVSWRGTKDLSYLIGASLSDQSCA